MPRGDTPKLPDLIIAGDLHIGDWQPECRTDNYLDAILQKISWLAKLQVKYQFAPIVFPGDLFNHWKADSELLNMILLLWPKKVLAIPGQHDLPQHNLELQLKTAFETMVLTGRVVDVSKTPHDLNNGFAVQGCAWGREPGSPVAGMDNVLVWHTTTWEKPFAPGQKAGAATRLLKKYDAFDLIITGDNHQNFVITDGRRKLVNAGSVMRMRSDQKNFQPCVYLWFAQTGELQKINIPCAENVISDERCKAAKEREERENAFISKIESGGDVSMRFEDNIDEALKDESDEVREVVLECTGR